ncbi:unnamed protein product [Fusarium venenatum]|uniref:alpha-glucosidase n=1 Tax=Fusarium venenatum TaxID=56646 RepID=A0A2L2T2B2_9HYPO|nr:uncharacterized protein FVRRES_00121 [Fusarium venenatum]CEI63609.1 unnamed protein product [Fusarium venenatum]
MGRYNEGERLTIVGSLNLDNDAKNMKQNDDQVVVHFGPSLNLEAVISLLPFSVDCKRDGTSQIRLNDQGLLNIQHWRPKLDQVLEAAEQKPLGSEDESAYPESVALDITFIGYDHFYGIREHAGPMAPKQTRAGVNGQYSEPYRVYNTDVFEYELNSPMILYGVIPFMQARRTTALPQEVSVAYHQYRWNYVSYDDVKDVGHGMDRFRIPYDAICMGKQLDAFGRKFIVIIDPHFQNTNGYKIVSELKAIDLAVHTRDGDIFEGHCWPGASHWIDCFNPASVEWWSGLFNYTVSRGTMENTFVWNDMNEPSVFNSPDITMPKDNLYFDKWEHHDLHNLNGTTFHNATYHAMMSRKAGELRRPFVLTRSFFAGSQSYRAAWSGDNQAS